MKSNRYNWKAKKNFIVHLLKTKKQEKQKSVIISYRKLSEKLEKRFRNDSNNDFVYDFLINKKNKSKN